MNVLKYLDVLIGLAIVMVLLSPLVTVVTQFCLWFFGRRPRTLKAGIRDLVFQLGNSSTTPFDRVELEGGPAGVSVTIAGLPPVMTDGNGAATVTGPIMMSDGAVRLVTSPGATFNVTLVPRWAAGVNVNSGPTDASGKTTLKYVAPAPIGYEPTEAHVTVHDGTGTPIEADVEWKTVENQTGPLTTPLKVRNGARAMFSVPGGATRASSLALELTVGDTSARPLSNCVVCFAFQRNVKAVSCAADAGGGLSIPLGGGLTVRDATDIAVRVLAHPMIATPGVLTGFTGRYYMGSVIEREELIRILLEFAANEGSGAGRLENALRAKLRNLLACNGIVDPGRTLAAIRDRAQEIELHEPSLAAHVRQTRAIIETAQGDFVGKINNWFDQVMLRVTNRYTFWARMFTVAAAFFVALGLQFDSLDLVRRLSIDDGLRNSLLQEAQSYQLRVDKLEANTAPAAADSTPKAPVAGAAQTAEQQLTLDAAKAHLDDIERNLTSLRNGQLNILPERFPWQSRPRARLSVNETWRPEQVPAELELVLGIRRYIVRPRWSDVPPEEIGTPDSVLPVLQHAIERSGAPVDVTLIPSADAELVVQGDGSFDFTLTGPDRKPLPRELLRREDETLRASLRRHDVRKVLIALRDKQTQQQSVQGQARAHRQTPASQPGDAAEVSAEWQLLVDDATVRVAFSAPPDDPLRRLRTAMPATLNPTCDGESTIGPSEPATDDPVTQVVDNQRHQSLSPTDSAASPQHHQPSPCAVLTLIASNPRTNWLMLRTTANSAADDILKGHVRRTARRVRFRASDVVAYAVEHELGRIEMNGVPLCSTAQECRTLDMQQVPLSIEQDNRFKATVRSLSQLALTSRTGGDIQLRSAVGHPETNILNREIEWVRPDYRRLDAAITPGTLLTWILLSLGAPFWYEMLKDTLRLRPELARREEAQRKDRQDDTAKPATAAAAKT